MEFFTGLDVGMDETAICVVDDKGQVCLQVTVVTDPSSKTWDTRARRSRWD